MSDKKIALVAGVGPGLGVALVQRFAAEGFQVAAIARNQSKLEDLIAARGLSDRATAYGCDIGEPQVVTDLFKTVKTQLGTPSLVAFNAGAFTMGSITELDPAAVDNCWRIGAFGGFLVGQQAAKGMLDAGMAGTILFTGATAGLRGSANFAGFAMSKFGLRALAQSMARELGPKGIHVAHIIIDGGIGENTGALSDDLDAPDKSLSPQAIAEAYWQLHIQHRSAWTQEMDLRPWVERF